MNDDSLHGFDRAPARYTGRGRETIDRMRDAAGELFERAMMHGLDVGDAAFYVHCMLTAMKYEDREGRKGDPAPDQVKARWYRAMGAYLLGLGPDPRAERPGFEPYRAPPSLSTWGITPARASEQLASPRLAGLMRLAEMILAFSRVKRKTFHPDGVRPETNSDHTVMLAVIASALAERHPELGLDPKRVTMFALLHDLVEVYAGDTFTFGVDAAVHADKAERERAAMERIERETIDFPWIAREMRAYEAQEVPEARWVRYLDKLLPRLTQALDGCATFRAAGLTVAEVALAHDEQLARLAAEYPEFAPVVAPLLREASDLTIAMYGATS